MAAETLMGAAWCVMLVCFLLFFHKYIKCYQRGVVQKEKKFYYQYKEMDPIARRVAIAFILFWMMTISLCFGDYDLFLGCLWKGALVCLLMSPYLMSTGS